MILKIQKSLYTSSKTTMYLIYNESRTTKFETSSKYFRRFFERGIDKVYVYVDLPEDSESLDPKLILTPVEGKLW